MLDALVRSRVLCCWPSWSLNQVKHSGGRKFTYIMIVAVCILRVELFGHCSVKWTRICF